MMELGKYISDSIIFPPSKHSARLPIGHPELEPRRLGSHIAQSLGQRVRWRKVER